MSVDVSTHACGRVQASTVPSDLVRWRQGPFTLRADINAECEQPLTDQGRSLVSAEPEMLETPYGLFVDWIATAQCRTVSETTLLDDT